MRQETRRMFVVFLVAKFPERTTEREGCTKGEGRQADKTVLAAETVKKPAPTRTGTWALAATTPGKRLELLALCALYSSSGAADHTTREGFRPTQPSPTQPNPTSASLRVLVLASWSHACLNRCPPAASSAAAVSRKPAQRAPSA